MKRGEACGVEHSRSDTGTVRLSGRLWFSVHQLWTQFLNPLSTFDISYAMSAGFPCPGLTVHGASQQTCGPSRLSLRLRQPWRWWEPGNPPSAQRPLCLLYHTHVRPLMPPVDHTVASHTLISAFHAVISALKQFLNPCWKDL